MFADFFIFFFHFGVVVLLWFCRLQLGVALSRGSCLFVFIFLAFKEPSLIVASLGCLWFCIFAGSIVSIKFPDYQKKKKKNIYDG